MIRHITPARSGKWLKCLQYETVAITSLVVEQMAYAQILQLIAIDDWVPSLTIHLINYIYSSVSHCYVNAYGLKHEPMFCWFGTSSKFMSKQISPLLQLLSSLHHPLPTNGLEKQTWLLTRFKLHLAICVRKRMPCKNIKICLTSLPFSMKYNCRKLFCFSQNNPHNHIECSNWGIAYGVLLLFLGCIRGRVLWLQTQTKATKRLHSYMIHLLSLTF